MLRRILPPLPYLHLALLCLLPGIAEGLSPSTPPYFFSTLAGTASYGSADGSGSAARFSTPCGVAVAADGTIYVADTWNHTIRRISTTGQVTSFAGMAGVAGNGDGSGSTARFNDPEGIAVDETGTLYVADTGSHTIRKITPQGQVSTLAGAADQPGSADGFGPTARFFSPRAVGVDRAGNVLVADTSNHTIRRITPQGVVSTVAGTAQMPGSSLDYDDTPLFYYPVALAVAPSGTVYVGNSGFRGIRKISPTGEVSKIAPLMAYGLAVDHNGNLYLANDENEIVQLQSERNPIVLAGKEYQGGSSDGVGAEARFGSPRYTGDTTDGLFYEHIGSDAHGFAYLNNHGARGLALDGSGNLFVADTQNNAIRKISPTATVSTVAGLAPDQIVGNIDAPGTAARFSWRTALAVSPSGEVLVADATNHTIRRISPDGSVTTFAGSPGLVGEADGPGPAARFSTPRGIAIDRNGVAYVADTGNRTIRRISPAGEVSTWAGSSGSGLGTIVDGVGTNARFSSPRALAMDANGTLYVADGSIIRRVSPERVVSTVAGSQGEVYELFLTTRPVIYYETIEAVAVDPAGRLYACYQMHRKSTFDSGYYTTSNIRQINSDGTYVIRAGSADFIGYRDGPDNQAGFDRLRGMVVDETGTIYVADSFNHVIRRISPDGLVSTLAGLAGDPGGADGVGQSARFYNPAGLALAADGSLYVSTNAAVHKGRRAAAPIITTQPLSQTVTAGGSVLFTVGATAIPEPTYQWYFNGNPFNGATGSSLSFANARSSDAGDYTVVVTNGLGSVTSTKAVLTVNAAPSSPASGGSGGGGGAPSGWFLLVLSVIGAARRLQVCYTP